MAVLRCDSCGGDTFEPLADRGYFRCHNCGAASSVKLVLREGLGAGLWLCGPGKSKIAVIKAVREFTGWGLKEAKDLVDASERSPQQIVVPAANPAAVDQAAVALRAAGAEISR